MTTSDHRWISQYGRFVCGISAGSDPGAAGKRSPARWRLAWRSLSALSSMKPRTPCWRPQAGWLVAYVAAAPPDDDALSALRSRMGATTFQQGLGAPSAAMGRQYAVAYALQA